MSQAPLRYVALGDSSAVGVGAVHGGYPDRIARRIEKTRPVKLFNLGVNGATAGEVVRSQLGRVHALDPQLVTLSVGSNDLWRMVSREDLEANLKQIAQALGQLSAKVFVSNIPDLSLAPVGKMAQQFLGITQAQLGTHIAEHNLAFGVFRPYPNITLFDTHALSQGELPTRSELFSADGFHPSDKGYEQWARLLWREMAKAGVPQDSAA